MKIKYHIIAIILFSGGMFTACYDLDLPPLNIIQDKDVFSSDQGIEKYMARMYSLMPFEDFKWSPRNSYFFDWLVTPGTHEGSSVGRDARAAFTDEGWGGDRSPYWTDAFVLLPYANRLLEEFPAYGSGFPEFLYNHYLGEAYFVRAMVFYALARRYGGIPLVTEVLKYPENAIDALEVPRSTEEDTWNQILADFDMAIAHLSETSPKRGYANKYVALGFKSEAMLYAGSVAKYNRLTGFGDKTGVRVIGFDPATSAAASAKYFREAYNAAREVMKSGKYSLYMKKWAAGDRQAQYQNMVDMFSDLTSPENIYIKEYFFPELVHGYDVYCVPDQMRGPGYGSGNCPTLDYVELFDGIDKNPDGTIRVFDDNGKYLLFDHPTDIFKNAEPRLRAYVIFPGDMFKGEEIEIRRGIYTGDVTNGISPLMTNSAGEPDYSYSNMMMYSSLPIFTGAGGTEKTLHLSASPVIHDIVTLADGTKMNGGGKCGPFTGSAETAYTGFYTRKWLNPNMPREMVQEGHSVQPFVLMRYGEILLNVAEAACELTLAGEAAPSGDNLEQIAAGAIRAIRERAGADPLTGTLTLNEDGLQVIRRERRKELAFENKIIWDIRRWRTQHSDKLTYGFTQSDGAYYKGLYPFYSSRANKYFFDARIEEQRLNHFVFRENNYYLAIPGGEVSKSPVIDQQPGR